MSRSLLHISKAEAFQALCLENSKLLQGLAKSNAYLVEKVYGIPALVQGSPGAAGLHSVPTSAEPPPLPRVG